MGLSRYEFRRRHESGEGCWCGRSHTQSEAGTLNHAHLAEAEARYFGAPDAPPEPRTPDETLAAGLAMIEGRDRHMPLFHHERVTLRDASKRLRELVAEREKLDWLTALEHRKGREFVLNAIAEYDRLAATLRAEHECARKAEEALAVKLCELGEVPDPRTAGLRDLPIREAVARNGPFEAVARSLTTEEVRSVVDTWFAARQQPKSETS